MLLVYGMSTSQNCIDYPPIEGPACGSCIPEDWISEASSPDIYDPTVNCSSSESPSGGNAINLFSNGSSDIEAVSTTATIDEFVEGDEYYFGMYFMSCNGVSVELIITVDDEEYTVGVSEEWEYFELCLTPDEASFEIYVTVEPYAGGEISLTLIDSGICDAEYCCNLGLEPDEEIDVMCPGDEQFLDFEYTGGEGDVEIEWTASPSFGLNYLSETDIINPTIILEDSDDFDGATIEYTVTVTDDRCSREYSFELTILPSLIPEFDFIICEAHEEQALPVESLEGFAGTWEGDFDFENLVGTFSTYTFTLNDDQINCIREWDYEIEIQAATPITFEVDLEYCVLDEERYELPDESEEGFEGEWQDDRIIPSRLGAGEYQYIFEVYDDEYCAYPFEMTVVVIDTVTPYFVLDKLFCSTADTIYLPLVSSNGIEGSWTPAFIDLNNPVQDEELVFIPDEDEICTSEASHIYSVLEAFVPDFNTIATVCKGQGLFVSEESLGVLDKGFYVPDSILLDTVQVDSIVIQWLPDAMDMCSQDTSITIRIVDNESVQFEIPEQLCKNSGVFNLPQTDVNAVTGQWNINQIDTDVLPEGMIDIEFIPDDNTCYNSYQYQIEITSVRIPVFDLDSVICETELPVELPLVSDNNIQGIWNPLSIDDQGNGQLIEAQFVPDALEMCADSISQFFTIKQFLTPEFNLPDFICSENFDYEFPVVDNAGLTGQWSIPTFEFAPGQLEIENTFTPDDLFCSESLNISIPVISVENLLSSAFYPDSCLAVEAILEFTGIDTEDYEISFNNGLEWQLLDELIQLGPGNYSYLIRHLESMCVFDREIEIKPIESIEFEALSLVHPDNCDNNNGEILIQVSGENIEYSLDGVNWQSDDCFKELSDDQYTVYARSGDLRQCIIDSIVVLDMFESVEIIDVEVQENSACNANDGIIEIEANGLSVEYSIDAGLTWTLSGKFENLEPDLYEIVVRSQLDTLCSDEQIVIIGSPDSPEIVNIVIEDLSGCQLDDGQLFVEATGENVMFSIDGGNTWIDSGLFTELEAGDYELWIEASDCITKQDFEIAAPVNLEVISIIKNDPVDCFEPDGKISIECNYSEIEISIDNGQTWTPGNSLSNLVPGEYNITIRSSLLPSCFEELSVELLAPDCPCEDLSVTLESMNTNCLDPASGSIEITSIQGAVLMETVELYWEDGESGVIRDNLSEGWYYYTVRYDLGCVFMDSVYINSVDPISFELIAYDQDCEELGIIEVTNISGGSGEFMYSIDGLNFQDNSVFVNLTAQEYEVLVQDAFGCTTEEEVEISDHSGIQIDIPGVEAIMQGDTAWFNPLIDESTIDDFEWSPVYGILNPGELIAAVSPDETTDYTLTIYFGNCIETRQVRVEVLNRPELYIPNIFNADSGFGNQFFYILSSDDTNIVIDRVSIYDRWGNNVFYSEGFQINDSSINWDGTFNDVPVIPGVYVYVVEYNINGQSFVRAGDVTVLR